MTKRITQAFAGFFLFCIIAVQAQEQDSVLTNYLQRAQYRQAIEYLNTQEATRNLEYQKALCYKWLSNYSKTIEILETLQKNYPEDISVQLELAQCYEANLQYPQSIYYYEKLIKADPANTYFQVQKADVLYRTEKYITALEEYMQIDPETYNPAYLKKSIALCCEKINQPDSAKVYYRAAWEIDNKDIFSALSLVKLCIRQEEYEEALSFSETFLSTDTTNAQMNVLNAFTYYNLSEYEEAVRRFEKCRTTGDSSLMVNRSIGISYFFLKNDTAAYPCLQQAYERDTTNMTVLYALASVNYNLGYYPEAIRAYQKLIERIVPNPNALYTYYNGLARACEKNSLYHDAVEHYLTAIRYAPSNAQKMDPYFNLSTMMEFNLQDYSKAVFYYTQYQATLLNYQNTMLEQAFPNPEQVKEIEFKLNELEKHIRQLKTEHPIDYTDRIWSN